MFRLCLLGPMDTSMKNHKHLKPILCIKILTNYILNPIPNPLFLNVLAPSNLIHYILKGMAPSDH